MTVSVVIPCHNAAPFIGEAIESALGQTAPPAEMIVVDDGSTDDSARVVESFGRRVSLIRRRRGGVSAARNAGIAAARGDLIASLDADDVWAPQKLERQLVRFSDPAVGLVYGRSRNFGPLVGPSPPAFPAELPEGDIFERLYLGHNFIPCSSVVVRRQALVDAGGFDEAFAPAADLDAWLRVALHWQAAAIPDIVCGYRIHPDQMSSHRADVVRCGLRVREKLAAPFERRTGMSRRQRRERLAQLFLAEIERMIDRGQLDQARALQAVVADALGRDTPGIRRALALARARIAMSTGLSRLRYTLRRGFR